MIFRVWLVFGLLGAPLLSVARAEVGMVRIPEGSYQEFYLKKNPKGPSKKVQVRVASFLLDKDPVSNSEFLDFVRSHPEWARSKAKRIFTESGYLRHWDDDLSFDSHLTKRPVVNVSWFAAQDYCESKNKTLPTTDQWEYALNDRGRNAKENQKRILAWYSRPNSAEPRQGPSSANGFGVRDLIGGVWEWTLDFNSFMVGSDSRSGTDGALFCGNGAQGAADAGDYAAFMRYSFRASLKASFVTNNLGFRCAKEIKK